MSGDKTEDPTPKKLRDLKKKGQIAFSKEVPSAALMIAFFGLFLTITPKLVDQSKAMVLLGPTVLHANFSEAADQLFAAYVKAMASMLAPAFLVVFVVGIAACILQSGIMFSTESVQPSLNKLNPATYFKNTFSIKNAIEFLKSVVKVGILTLVVYFLVKDGIRASIAAMRCGVPCLQAVLGGLLTDLAIWSSGPFIVIAFADFAFQKWQFTNQNKMSKDEVKREYKESEGDPMIKGMRKQLHQQLLAEGNIQTAREATVLVTNPTHIAVAIVYEEGKTPLPIVTAVGVDYVAHRMMKAAEEAGVPIMRNVPLARGLFENASIDQYVPSDLIEPMAEVLRAIRDLRRQH